MNYLDALILGIVQGLTEFLPVSSSGHIELGKEILNIKVKDNVLFSVVVHAATALSTIVIFWKDIVAIIQDLFKFQLNENTRFALKIALSTIPVLFVGLLFEDQIEAFFSGQVLLVGTMLLITGALLTFSYLVKDQTQSLTYPKAFIVGLAQAFAVLPGVSRSGATIATALILKVNRETAARFSFLMVLIPILGATVLKLKDYLEAEATTATASTAAGLPAGVLVVGFIAAFLSGLLACRLMLRIVKNGKLIYFAYYCFIIGTLAILSTWL